MSSTATAPAIAPLATLSAGPASSRPVVLLHSAGLDATHWDGQFKALGDHRHLIAVDLPGHGDSPGVPADFELGLLAARVGQTLTGAGVDALDLVGLSVGGLVAQRLALDQPELVRSLTLIDTAATFSTAGRDAMRARARTARAWGTDAVVEGLLDHWFLPETRRRRPDLVARAARTVARQDPELHAALWEMIAGVDLVDELGAIAAPTLVVVGEHDSTSPVAAARQLARCIADARLRVIPNAAHLAPLERPETVARLLDDFLEQRS